MPRSRTILSLLITTTAIGACFDDAKLRPLDGGNDLGPVDVPTINDAGEDVNDGATESDASQPADVAEASDVPMLPPCLLDRVLVTTTNFTNGGYALGRFAPTPSLTATMGMSPDQDHLPVQSGCVVYNLLRGNDVLAVLDPMDLPSVARRIPLRSAGADAGQYQANPYDVLTLSPTKAYVVQYAVPRIAIVDPSRDGADAVRGSIDLAPLRAAEDRDPSGAMEAVAITRVGRNVFVALQNLNSFMPVTRGSLAVIEPGSDQLIDAAADGEGINPITLGGNNPVAMRVTMGGRLVVALAGVVAFSPPQMLDGGIEVIDPVTLRGGGLRVTERDLGGDLVDFVMLDDARGWAVVSQLGVMGMNTARVVEFNLDNAEGMRVGNTIVSTGSIGAIARDPAGNVWVLDRTAMRSGARVFSPSGMELTDTPLSTGMYPPAGIAFVP